MSASINTSEGSLGPEFLKKSAGYIVGGMKTYFKDVMPNTSSTISEAKSTINEVKSTLSTTAQDILPRVRQMKSQVGIKSMLNWFIDKEDEYSSSPGGMNELNSWDDGTTSTDIAEIRISEVKENANQISGAIIESTHKAVESQIQISSNILSSIDKQTAVVSAGFDKTNNTLNKILEVLTKNTSALIETVAVASSNSTGNNMTKGGIFNLSDYKKMVKNNLTMTEAGSLLGTAAAYLPLMKDGNMMKQLLSPDNIVSMLMGGVLNKKSPNLKNNLKALDDTINNIVMSSLIRLGEGNNGRNGFISRVFGIDSRRKDISTERSSLELKSTPFDTVTKEAITSAIPGYLRKILVALGGEDVVYDYRSRKFRTQRSIRNEFRSQGLNEVAGSLYKSSNKIRNTIGSGDYESMLYDLMMHDLGTKSGRGGSSRNIVGNFSNVNDTEKYILGLLGNRVSNRDKQSVRRFAESLKRLGIDSKEEIIIQAASNNANRNSNMKKYVEMMDALGVDLSFIQDNADVERGYIKKGYKRGDLVSKSEIDRSSSGTSSGLRGIDYTNAALYEIYRRLNEGINVFQVGSKRSQSTPFRKFDDSYLSKPTGYRAKSINGSNNLIYGNASNNGDMGGHEYGNNPLINNVDENGNKENLSRADRFKRWGRTRGSQFRNAMFNGSPEDVKAAVLDTFRDISGIASEGVKKGISKINDSFGNISGYLSHKIFGSEYTYNEYDPNTKKTIQKTIAKNEKGGLFGFVGDKVKGMFESGKQSFSKWFNDVSKYFDYGGSGEDKGVVSKRKKLMNISVGALSGAGILGGPIGLLVGAVAGNALSASNIGNKLKEKLFGKDKETGKPTGILSKAADAIVTPIQYQFAKATHNIGNILKKNIFGPLSDVGWAIKERISNAAHDKFSKFFGFITDGLKRGIGSIGKFAGKIFGGLFNIGSAGVGKYAEARTAAGTFVPGFLMNRLADLIAPGFFNEKLRERRRSRNEDIKNDRYMSKDDFKSRKYAKNRNSDAMSDIANYTAEQVASTREIESINSNIESNTGNTVRVLEDIRDRLSGGRSSGNRRNAVSNNSDDGFANGALAAGITAAMSSENMTNNEYRESVGLVDEIANGRSNKRTIGAKLKSIIGMQKHSKDEDGSQKSGLFTLLSNVLGSVGSVFGSILSNLPTIGAILAGLYVLFKNPEAVSNTLNRIGTGIEGIYNFFTGNSDKDATTTGMNAVTSVLDVQANSGLDYVTPGASLYHTSTDAAGNQIKNYSATELKEELLWKSPLRSQITGNMSIGTGINTLKSNIKMRQAQLTQNLINFSNNRLGGFMSKRLNKTLDRQLNSAASYDAKANSASNTNAAASIGRTAGKIGVIYGAGGLSDWAVSGIASKMGASEETSNTLGNVANIAVSGGLTANAMKSAVTNKKSIVDKVLDGITSLFKWIGEKLGAEEVFKGVSSSKLVSSFNKMGSTIIKVIKDKFDDLIVKKIITLFAKWGIEVSASAVTAGIAIAVGAVAGLASGLCSVEHLFGVLPGDADPQMIYISGVMKALLGALEWSPLGWIVVIFDVLDGILCAIPQIELKTPLFTITIGGVGIKQLIARATYAISAFGSAEKLEAKQAKFDAERTWYNETFGTNIDSTTFNDMVNTTGFFSRIWNGTNSINPETGHLYYDEAGAPLPTGGMKSWFVGKEKEYVHDEEGNVLRDSSGAAIAAVDQYGNTQYKDSKWGNSVGNWFRSVGRFFTGGDIYKTDENGNAIYDPETGTFVVDSTEGNILQKMGLNVSNEALKRASDPIKVFGQVADVLTNNVYETDENGDPILDENGNPIEKDSIADNIIRIIGEAKSAALEPFSGIGSIISKINQSDVMLDENGDPILDENGNPVKKKSIADWVTSISGKINSFLFKPIQTTLSVIGGLTGDSNELDITESPDVTNVLELLGKIGKTLLSGIATGGPESSDDQSTSDVSNESTDPGGNPINKPFKITSRFGATSGRPHSGSHTGIDIVPIDGSNDAIVGSRFAGTVTEVKSGIPDNIHAVKDGDGNWTFPYDKKYQTGNMVTITTDDGLVIKNMHLKAGSIPSNIRAGARVNIGDKLGKMGSTGWSTGTHLHYEFNQNGKAIDPTQSASSGSTMSFNSSNAASTKATSNVMAGITSGLSAINTSTASTEETSNQGVLSKLMDTLKSAGSEFLNKLTGGLFGSTSSSSESTVSSTSSGLTVNSEGITGNCNNRWISIVRDVKQLVAAQKPTYDQSRYIYIDYNGRRIKTRTDCTGIICTMLKCYGVMNDNENLNSTAMLRAGAIKNGFDLVEWPGWDKLVEGDILVVNGHAEIFCKNEGNKHYVYNGGSTSALCNPGASSSSKSSYSKIWRCREEVVQMANGNYSDPSTIVGSNSDEVYAKLKKLGYSDAAASGILGVWHEESKNDSKTVEGYYLKKYPGYDSVMSSNQSMNDYTKNVLFPAYSKMKINKSAYLGADGNYYPGIGLAQWTGPRHYDLKKYADSKSIDWRDLDTQISFMEQERSSRGIGDDFKDYEDPAEAAEFFARNYEGTNLESMLSPRRNNAVTFYNQYSSISENQSGSSLNANSMMNTDGNVGGPENSASIGLSNYSYKTARANIQKDLPTGNSSVRWTQNGTSNGNISTDGSSTNAEMVRLLQEVLIELKAINGNTGTSNSLLNSINENGFVDQGLRNSLNSLKSPSGKTTTPRSTTSSSNNRMISSMIRP